MDSGELRRRHLRLTRRHKYWNRYPKFPGYFGIENNTSDTLQGGSQPVVSSIEKSIILKK